ncbi:MAG: phospholipase D-like domain-containing protein [Candidatus Eisenbacteria bacterium]
MTGLFIVAATGLMIPAGLVPAAAGDPGGVTFTSLERAAPPPLLQLVESVPIETSLDHADLPDAYQVWAEMIANASDTIDLAQFYASDTADSRLGPIILAIEAAAERGVRVRFLAEKRLHATYPQTLDRLAACAGIEVRLFDGASLVGGVLHAKYFIVDGREAFLGSQNFDWRALTHIVELGVRIREPHLAQALSALFQYDWDLAGTEVAAPAPAMPRTGASGAGGEDVAPPAPSGPDTESAQTFPIAILLDAVRGGGTMPAAAPADAGTKPAPAPPDTVWVTPLFSPRDRLPAGARWDLPELIRMIDSARDTVQVQLLTYRAMDRDGSYFADLESALRRAAARGVTVELLLSDWCKRRGTIEGLQSLQALPGFAIRLVTIPPWSGGFVPFARVIHAKYMVVDGREAWIGTSNWEWDYFHASRNVGLHVRGRSMADRLRRFFLDLWKSPYAVPVDPCARYTVPRIGE